MFSYYGSKSRIARYYPAPTEDRIIEYFAGSARYSLLHFEKEVTLIDKYPVIIDLWKWLQQCSEKDILSLPTLRQGDKIDDFDLSKDEKIFLGFMAGIASFSPRKTVSKFAAMQFSRGNKLQKVASQLHKIRHWQIIEGCYSERQDQMATHFIDAPYQFGGHSYKKNKIDYMHLAQFCRSRQGQVIVCENSKADWLPFIPLKGIHGAMSYSIESIWTTNNK